MINNFSFFKKTQTISKNKLEITCPYCYEKNPIDKIECDKCHQNLSEFISVFYSHYAFFNESIICCSKNDYTNALFYIIKYLAYEPNNKEANKLYLYLLFKLNMVEEVEKEIEIYEKKYSRDPWIMNMINSNFSMFELPNKITYDFSIDDDAYSKIKNKFLQLIKQNNNCLVEILKRFFDLMNYYKNTDSYEKVIDFYNFTLIPLLNCNNISVISHNGVNYHNLDDNELINIEIVCNTESNKYEVGTLVTIQPQIKINNTTLYKEKVMYVNKKVEKDESIKIINGKRVRITKKVYNTSRKSKYIKSKKYISVRAYRMK